MVVAILLDEGPAVRGKAHSGVGGFVGEGLASEQAKTTINQIVTPKTNLCLRLIF